MPFQITAAALKPRLAPAISFLLFALTLTWSVAGTIALRNTLLVLLMVMTPLAGIDWRTFKRILVHPCILLLFALSAWIIVHNQWLAWNSKHAWDESGQWFKSVVCLGIGLALGCSPRLQSANLRWIKWITPVAAAWSLHLLLNMMLKDWRSLSLSAALQAGTLIGTRDMVSYLGTGLLALLLADGVARSAGSENSFRLPTKYLWCAILATIILTTATMTRNSTLVMAVEIAIGIAALIGASSNKQQILRRSVLALTAMLLVSAVALTNFTLDARWKNFSDSARIGWDIEHHNWWIDQVKNPWPTNAQGVPVDHSAYNRIAWIRGASHLITEYPLGTGYNRNAFRQALMRHYGADSTASGHAHAGFFDFTLATGLPGGLLLIATLLSAIGYGWKRWQATRAPASLALMIFVAGYFMRSAVDGIVRDHMLEQAMFVMGLLLAASATDLTHGKTTR